MHHLCVVFNSLTHNKEDFDVPVYKMYIRVPFYELKCLMICRGLIMDKGVHQLWLVLYRKGTSIRQAPVFRHLRALRKSPWKFIIWMNDYNYTGCCWFPTSSNILILPSQFWQIRFESYWLHWSKCRILVLLRYCTCMCSDSGGKFILKPKFSLGE